MKRRGFTIIELIIVISIMTILLVLGVVNMSASQANGRDQERKIDIDTIALNLEGYYTNGTDGSSRVNTYPSIDLMSGASATSTQMATLRDIDLKSLVAPGAPDSSTTSLVVATNNTQTTAGVLPQPADSKSQNQYIYQPLKADGSLCSLSSQECRKFNLFYKTETDSTVQMVTSKRQ